MWTFRWQHKLWATAYQCIRMGFDILELGSYAIQYSQYLFISRSSRERPSVKELNCVDSSRNPFAWGSESCCLALLCIKFI